MGEFKGETQQTELIRVAMLECTRQWEGVEWNL